jgi:hypothetical protein
MAVARAPDGVPAPLRRPLGLQRRLSLTCGRRILRWARQAGAALSCVIVVMRTMPNGHTSFVGHEYKIAEISVLDFLEYIRIGYSSPQMKALFCSTDFTQFTKSKLAREDCSVKSILAWPNRGYAAWSVADESIVKIIRDDGAAKLYFGENLDFIGRGLPVVVDDWPKLETYAAILTEIRAHFDRDVRAQLTLGSTFRTDHQVSRCPPKSESKGYEKGIGDFQSSTQNGPEFGSLVVPILGLIAASWMFSRFRTIAILLGFQSLFGLLCGFDFCSLWRMIW